MRHSSFIGIAATALFSIAVSLIAASFFLQTSSAGSQSSHSATTTAAVEAFYAAANEAIATGSIAALDAVVAPHFVDREPLPGMRPGREGLADYLLTLHAAAPAMKLTAEPILAADGRAMARVAVEGLDGPPPLAGTIVEQPEPWGAVDVFRVADGQIVERWGHVGGLTLVRPLAHGALDLAAPAPRHVTLARVGLEIGASWRPVVSGPEMFFLEKGVLQVELEAPARNLSLSAGQSLTLEPASRVNLTNTGMDRADVLVASLRVPEVPGPTPPPAAMFPPGVSSAVLAGDFATDVGIGPATLELGQVTLAPHSRMTLSSAKGPTLLALQAGQPEVTAWGRALFRRGRDGAGLSLMPATMAPGDGILLHPGSRLIIENAGSDTVITLVLTIRPVGEAGS